MYALLIVLLALCSFSFAAEPLPVMARVAPKLPPAGGHVVLVNTADQLRAAVAGCKDGDTIAIADGTYQLVPYVWLKNKKNVVIRSVSGDPTKVILRGKGWDQGSDHGDEDIMWMDACENVTIADITFAEVHAYGLKCNADQGLKNINVYNCHFRDIGIRGIKGTKGDSGKKLEQGSVRYCLFQNTRIPPKSWQADGDYITSIDMMRLDGWTFADNFFKDIKGANGQARGAVFVWVESNNVTVERNVFIDCDRSVCFGNPSNGGNTLHMKDSVCRNNFIVTGSADSGVEVSWAENIRVFHNTVLKRSAATRSIRVVAGTNCKDVQIANNLFSGSLELNGAKEFSNLSTAEPSFFVYPEQGNLRLTALAAAAIGKGAVLTDCKEDFDGAPRDAQPDIGAWEFGAKAPATLPGIGGTPVSASSASKPSGAEFTAGIKPKDPAPKIDAPGTVTAPPKPAPVIASGPFREAIIKALQTPGGKSGVKVFVSVFGRKQEAPYRGADANGIKIDVQGNAMPIVWKDLSDAEVVHLGTTIRPDDGETIYQAGALASAAHLEAQFEKISERLYELDAEKAKKLKQLLAGQ